MNYIVISPYYPQNFQQFTVELANKGITVLGIGQEPYDQLDQPLKNALTEYFRVENLENLDEVKRAVAFLFFKRAGVPVVPGQIVKTLQAVDMAISKIGLPMIAKPDNGVGAAGTYKLETTEDVEQFKQEWDKQTVYFFEKFVDSGQICTFDGLLDSKGNIVFSTTFDYAYTPLDLVLNHYENSYYKRHGA